MKKLIALLLALILTFSVSPLAFAVGGGSAPESDIWDVISDIEANAAKRTQAATVESLTECYSNAVDEIIAAVTSSSSYVPDTLERHGDFFFWVDTNGDPNGYSPNYRAKRKMGAIPGAVLGGTTEVVNYGVKGGSPASFDVAAFQPYIGIDSSFTAQYETRCNAIAQATGGVGTTYKQSNANVNNLGIALDTCGVVIFDSHGTTDYSGYGGDYTSQANSSYLCLTTGTGLTTADKSSAQGEFGTYYHAFSLGGGEWAVDGTAITNHMNGTAPNSLVWMAICLGMATDGLEAPFHNRGAEVVYGYSQSVTFSGDYKFEGFFWPYMCQDHTVAEACAYMKTKSNCDWDPAYSGYSYSQAVANYVAFPIVSSSEDPYLGHGNVDVIQVPNSLWTLFTQFNIAACSNNDAWGTVTVSGRQITATPAVGYEVVGYEVLSGSCTVTQNGNVFQVEAESDCEIQINFAARVPAAVSFVVPEGVSVENFNGYINDVTSFPEPAGDPIADAYHYRFLGWAEAALDEDSQEMPMFHKAGESLTVTQPNATYYALYKYFVAADGVTEGNFTLVTQAPASWVGDYVIAYHDDSITKVLDATGEITGSSIGGSRAAHDLEEIGGTLEDNVLYNIPDDYIFSFEPAGSGAYALKMKEHDVYLALTSDSNALMTATNSGKSTAKWTLSCEPAGVKITNLQYNRSIRFNDKAKLFRCYASGQQQISLYFAGEGTTWFTTDPKSKNICEEHSFGDWTVTQAPTCTNPGSEKRVCTVCGFAEYNELPALGHDYVAGTPVAPTCTEQGFTTYTCSRCGDSYTDDYVDALGHDYQVVVTTPTCTERGFSTYTCSRCGDSYVDDYVDALGHDFGEWVETTAPGCTEAGEETSTCSRCGETMTRPVDALGHDFGEWVETTAPGCTEAGEETSTCSRCGETMTRPVDALGHDFGEWVETTAPGCTEAGEETSTCSRCGETMTRPVDALGHDYQAVVTNPTCTESGFTTYTCSRCEDSYTDDETEALGHDYQAVVTNPTCTEGGFTTYTCSRCEDSYTGDETEALGHDYQAVVTNPTCTEGGFTTFTCSRCEDSYTGDETEALGHDYQAVVTNPTCTEGGFTTFTCTRCEDSYVGDETEALGHSWATPSYAWAETETGWTCTGTAVCLNDETHVNVETVEAVYSEISAPSYTNPGAAVWTAVFAESCFTEQVREVVIPVIEPIVMHFLPGEIDGEPISGEPFSISSDDEASWSEFGNIIPGTFVLMDNDENPVWFCYPECPYEAPEGYRFMGWKSIDSSEDYFWDYWDSGDMFIAQNDTMVAQWAREFSITTLPIGDYAEWVGVDESAAENFDVSFMIELSEEAYQLGYRLEKVTVSDADGNVLMEITEDIVGNPFVESETIVDEEDGKRIYIQKFKMPASDIVLSASFLEPAPPHDCPCAAFVDMPEYGTVEHDAIDWAFTHTPQITAGTNSTHFAPETKLNRATAMTFLWAAAGKPEPKSTTSPFSDVKMNKWYTKAILWAAENKITSGNTDGSFGIKTICNRGHILTFLYAQQGKPGYSIENPYSDASNKWFTKAAVWAYENGIEKGENGKFNYKTTCTRVIAVTYIYRTLTGMGLIE